MQEQIQKYQGLLGEIQSGIDKIYKRVSAVPELNSLTPTNVVPGTAPNIRALVNKGYIPPVKRVGERESIDSFLEEIVTTLQVDIDVLKNPDASKKSLFGKKSQAAKHAEKILEKYEPETLERVYAELQQVLRQDIEDSIRYWVGLQEKTGEEARMGTKLTPEDEEKLQPMLQILALHTI